MGPYQVVRRGNTWYCENGTLQIFQTHVGVLLVIIPVMRLRLLADLTMNSAV